MKISTFGFKFAFYPMMNLGNDIKIKCFLILVLSGFFSPLSAFATHQRAAEITYRHLYENTYEITLITYTRTGMPANAYRNFLPVNWGDGTISDIERIEIRDLPGDPEYGITYNRYMGTHSYPGPSSYVISMEDPNRNQGILNIPNSVNIPLYVYAELVINPFLGYNNSPVLLIPPVDNACVDQPFFHNPGAYDPDGDSLSYRLVTCLGAQGLAIPGYTLPPATLSLSLDPISGNFIWDSPPYQGQYNIAILIEEWRNGTKIGSVLRDMQIIVIACNSEPPVIDQVADTCVVAGDTLIFHVTAHEPHGDSLALYLTGGPMILSNHPATVDVNPVYGSGIVTATFRWNTVCDHVKLQPYRMFFKANNFASPVNQVDIKSMQINVIGPAPQNLTATPLGTSITLGWDPYSCQNAKGFDIYRKSDSTGFVPGYCQTGVPAALGYTKIATVNDVTAVSYVDNNSGQGLNLGNKYCYLIVAFFTDKAESYASNEACASLKKDIPVLTHVSIKTTDEITGSIYVAWSKPTELDTIQAPGPYKYVINRSVPGNPGQFIAVDSLTNLNDTIFSDTLLNTKAYNFLFRIDFYNLTPGNFFLIGHSQVASSIYLDLYPTDKKMILKWNNAVPWTNYAFTIYRLNLVSQSYDSIGTTDQTVFTDKGRVNGEEYCYLVKSTGRYSAPGFIDPIINYSQKNCGIPVDNIPPCPPYMNVRPECENRINTVSWKNPVSDSCTPDIIKYYLYFTPGCGKSMILLDSLSNINDTVYLHHQEKTNVGCYSVVAMDSAGNRSVPSDTVCIDLSNLPEACQFRLPVVFTPNNDNVNDFFMAYKLNSADRIKLTVFDRWGKKVYETEDPNFNWDGTDQNNHKPCSDGAYFYICDIFETSLSCELKRTIRGSVTILR